MDIKDIVLSQDTQRHVDAILHTSDSQSAVSHRLQMHLLQELKNEVGGEHADHEPLGRIIELTQNKVLKKVEEELDSKNNINDLMRLQYVLNTLPFDESQRPLRSAVGGKIGMCTDRSFVKMMNGLSIFALDDNGKCAINVWRGGQVITTHHLN